MTITPENLTKHELIGLKAKVDKSKNKDNEKIYGQIVDETHHTLTIEQDNKDKRVFKKAVTLVVELPNNQKIEVDGKILVGKPWERIKKK